MLNATKGSAALLCSTPLRARLKAAVVTGWDCQHDTVVGTLPQLAFWVVVVQGKNGS